MKLFSLGRTDLAVSSKLPTPVGLVKCRKTIIVLRTSVMVWYTWRSPWTVVFAHSVQSWCDARPASPRFMKKLWTISYSSRFDGKIPLKTTEIHILITRCNTYRDSFEKHPSISVSPKLPPNSCQGSTRDTNRLTTRPPTPFIEPPRHEKVNFHRLIELNLIDPEKILEFCIL